MTSAAVLAERDLIVATRLFGDVIVSHDAIIEFPEGIPGFSDARRFALLPTSGSTVSWLQSMEVPALAFLLLDWTATGQPASYADASAYAVVTLAAAGGTATVNLQAPVLIDRRHRRGFQVIRSDAAPGTAVPIDLEAVTAAG